MSEGYISLHRKIFDNPLSKKPLYLSIWIYIISNAYHVDSPYILYNEKIIVPAGSYYGSIQKISNHFNVSKSMVSKILEYFEKEGMLNTKRTRNYTLFQVVNYKEYQKKEHKKNHKRTQKETNNNNNNNNNDNNILSAFSIYNEMAESCGLPICQKKTDGRIKLMNKRLKDVGGIDGWREAINIIRNSEYLTGRVNGWKADIDFILREDKFTKIMEGAYNGKSINTKQSRTDSIKQQSSDLLESIRTGEYS